MVMLVKWPKGIRCCAWKFFKCVKSNFWPNELINCAKIWPISLQLVISHLKRQGGFDLSKYTTVLDLGNISHEFPWFWASGFVCKLCVPLFVTRPIPLWTVIQKSKVRLTQFCQVGLDGDPDKKGFLGLSLLYKTQYMSEIWVHV